jgi:2-keto-3-deoxy-L-rhamnonate aldolase RhmA
VRNRLRERWRDGQTAYGVWITLESPSLTEAVADLGIDWICVEMEHGHLGYKEVLEHLRAAQGSGMAVLVRVPDITLSAVKRVLDLGAHGVLLPLPRSAGDVELGFQYARYPPRGRRGIGGERAVRWGLRYQEYLDEANSEVLVIPLIETVEAAASIHAILDVPGLEAIFMGPADLSATHGYLGAWEGPGVAELILEIAAAAAGRGIVTGVMSRGYEDARRRHAQGFKMISLGADMGLFVEATRAALAAVGDPAADVR